MSVATIQQKIKIFLFKARVATIETGLQHHEKIWGIVLKEVVQTVKSDNTITPKLMVTRLTESKHHWLLWQPILYSKQQQQQQKNMLVWFTNNTKQCSAIWNNNIKLKS